MKLSSNEIVKNISELNQWTFTDNKITKSYTFATFSDALAFVLRIGIESEKQDHHPDISIHSWNKVDVFLSTHSAGGITKKDVELAKVFDKIFS